MTQKNKTPFHAPTLKGGNYQNSFGYYTKNNHALKRRFDRRLLPTPATYYCKAFPTLKINSEWVKVHCCFHADTRPSLNLHLISGGFYCFACGAKGGDVLAFHRQRYAMSFVAAVNYFGVWVYEH